MVLSLEGLLLMVSLSWYGQWQKKRVVNDV
jgi:hypothetical protein